MKTNTRLLIRRGLLLALLLPIMTGCLDELLGPSFSGSDLQSIAVTSSSASVEKGQTIQFTALGSFSDGTEQNITNDVDWASSQPSVASITTHTFLGPNGGIATGLTTGQTNITATYGSIQSPAVTLTVFNDTTTTISFTNRFNREIVYEVWNGDDLYYTESQVVGYGEKLYPTGATPVSVLDGSTDSVTVAQAEEITTLLVVVGVPYEGTNYYLTDQSFSNLGSSLDLLLCDDGEIDETTDTTCP